MADATDVRFKPMQRHLHWAVVILILLQYLFFDDMGRPFDRVMETGVASYTATPIVHILIGASVLGLAAWRLALRRRYGAPPPPAQEPAWGKKAARITHDALYFMLFALPITGMIAWFGGVEAFAEIHEIGTTILLLLVALHVGAVGVHQFIWKTNLIHRMW